MEANSSDSVDLIAAVDQKIEKVRTRSLDLSFNELLDMYRNKELIIDPEYQRLFRWSEESQSRFIESLILELPIPPIFVIEREQGIYELIDGLQRISTYLHFRGEHPDRRDDTENMRFLELVDCDIVKELNGYTLHTLPKALEIKLKRNFIRVEVLRKESDQRIRYYMFKRLNTGGSVLSEQEIRNCTMRLLDPGFVNFIINLSANSDFQACIENLSDEQKNRKYDQELVLRFFAFKNNRNNYVHEVGDFMTDYMELVSDPDGKTLFDYSDERTIFDKTFQVLNKSLGDTAFSGANNKGTMVTRFLAYHYEAFTVGLQPYLDKLDPEDDMQMEQLKHKLLEIKRNEIFRAMTTGGSKNYSKPLRDRIDFVINALTNL